MEYRTLAHTDLTLSAITFGSWAAGGWMWGKSNRDEAVKAISGLRWWSDFYRYSTDLWTRRE